MASQLQFFLLPANFELDGMTSHKHGLADKTSFKMAASKEEVWASFAGNEFLQGSRYFTGLNFFSRKKTQSLLALNRV